MSDRNVIETRALTKRYHRQARPALDALSLTVRRGEIFGYLGPNGAGKTTTIRLLLDLIRPSSGDIRIFGRDPRRESRAVRNEVGNLPGELQLWDHLTGRQILEFLAGLRPGCELSYAYTLAERLRLDLTVKSGSYSTGNKRKVGIVQAMMHRPALLILDEPTNGLDPLVRQEFNAMLDDVRNDGRTVFLSSHVLPEAQAVCDRIGILRDGVLQTVSDIHGLQTSIRRQVTLFSKDSALDRGWDAVAGVHAVDAGQGYVRLQVSGSLDAVLKHAAGFTIDDVQVEAGGLEEMFMELYSDHA